MTNLRLPPTGGVAGAGGWRRKRRFFVNHARNRRRRNWAMRQVFAACGGLGVPAFILSLNGECEFGQTTAPQADSAERIELSTRATPSKDWVQDIEAACERLLHPSVTAGEERARQRR